MRTCPKCLGKFILKKRKEAHLLAKQLTLASLLLKWPPVIPLQGPDRAGAAWKRSGMAACWLVGWQFDWCCGKALPLCGVRELERAQHLSSPFPLFVLGVGGSCQWKKKNCNRAFTYASNCWFGDFLWTRLHKTDAVEEGEGNFKKFLCLFFVGNELSVFVALSSVAGSGLWTASANAAHNCFSHISYANELLWQLA